MEASQPVPNPEFSVVFSSYGIQIKCGTGMVLIIPDDGCWGVQAYTTQEWDDNVSSGDVWAGVETEELGGIVSLACDTVGGAL